MAILGVEKKQREIGPELLRIFAMLLIILHHIAAYGDFVFESVCFNSVFRAVLTFGGTTGVNIFVLISGYYSVKSKPRAKKAVLLISQTVFYCIVSYLVSCAVGVNAFRPKYLFYSSIPFVSNKGYWFITIYILLYALIPFINGGLQKLTKTQHILLIALFLIVWNIIPKTYGYFFSGQSYGLSELGWFVFAYSVGAYLRMYPIKLYKHRGIAILLFIGVSALLIASKILLETNVSFSGIKGTVFKVVLNLIGDSSLYGPISFVFSVLALIVFQQSKLKPNRVVYMISASTFGVYLIHDSIWLKRFIWDDLFNLKGLSDSPHFVVDLFIVMIITFICCSIIDILRKKLLEEPIFNSKLYAGLEDKIKKIFFKRSESE